MYTSKYKFFNQISFLVKALNSVVNTYHIDRTIFSQNVRSNFS